MIGGINLATHPFTNRRLVTLGLGVLSLLCLGLTGHFADELKRARVRQAVMATRLSVQERQMAKLRQRIPPPVTPDQLSSDERELLEAAAILIERRVFPWSKLLGDLESNLGKDVRLVHINVALEDVSQIDPLRPGTAPMEVSMQLIGRRLDDVLETIRALRATGRFSHFRPRKQSPVEGTQEVEYEIDMTYRP